MTTLTATALPGRRTGRAAAYTGFGALLARDLVALRRRPSDLVARAVIQPTLLVFVLGYVSPKIGHTPAGAVAIATTLLAGMLATVMLFQGIFAVGMPLIQEFGYTREIEDRVLAPLPVELVALAKVLAGAVQAMIGAAIVFPLAVFVPASRPDIAVHPLVLCTLAPLAALTCASLGLFLGTAFDPRAVTGLLAIILTPLMYLGCTFYPWSGLRAVRWVQVLSLANPLTYISEGFRAAVTTSDHLTLLAVYPVLCLFNALLLWQGMRHFRRRVVT
jgi:ABC-2 type transport system permease protein